MQTDEQDVFEESMKLNEQTAEHYLIEPAIWIDNNAMQACPGVNIEIDHQNVPVFISSEQLRRMADMADEEASRHISFR